MATETSRVWFITGASSGIGQELARQALGAGEAVAAVARNKAAMAGLGGSGQLLAVDADVRDEAAVAKAVDAAASRFGRIDVVANNAGYGLFGAVEEAADAQARAIFDTNVFGVLNVLRAVLPVLRAQRSGHILQGSSYFGQTAIPGVGLLAATKYAVEGLSDALAAEVAPLGIKVTLIQPGLVATPFLANLDTAATTQPGLRPDRPQGPGGDRGAARLGVHYRRAHRGRHPHRRGHRPSPAAPGTGRHRGQRDARRAHGTPR
jgi:NAD(P)-dependent dehydrogenase (short-subunit alcohol dehydrogenase family)